MDTTADPLLDIKQAQTALLEELGLKRTYSQMQRAATERKLPFFKPPVGTRLVIRKSDLLNAFNPPGEGNA